MSTIGRSEIDLDTVSDGATGQARFAFLILLFLLIGKSEGAISPIPAIGGFFTYFVAAVSQSMEVYDD